MTQKSSYTLKPPPEQKKYRRYRQEELARMTTMQLMDICESEGIINAAIDRMDKGELIHLIMQFRGSRTPHLILTETGGGKERLEEALEQTKKREIGHKINISGKITAYSGLDTGFFDGITIPHMSDLEDVNAVILDNRNKICGIFQVRIHPGHDFLYLTRSGELPCVQSEVKDYRLILFPQTLSDAAYRIYTGELKKLPPEIQIYVIPLLDFVVLEPATVTLPLVMDFGTTNTSAGFFLDHMTYEKIKDGVRQGQLTPNAVNYVQFLTTEGEIAPVLPTVIGVGRIENGKIIYKTGYDAEKMIEDGYTGNGFSVFYDIKRWVSDYMQDEEVSDHLGNRVLVKRKDLIKEYLLFVIKSAEQRFKCLFQSVFFSYPVKQGKSFVSLYKDVLKSHIEVLGDDMIDEGVAVLYSTISMIIDKKQYTDGQLYKALIVDCGGGTTDLSTCLFKITNERISYNIEIETAYENGDTDFGGNNLTYRIMQLIKVALAREITGSGTTLSDIAGEMDVDIYRMVEGEGVKAVYKMLDEAYAAAEYIVPTKFKEYEYQNREEYYMVRNNMYFLFTLAEKIKKKFFANLQILQVSVGQKPFFSGSDYAHIYVPRWKWAARVNGKLAVKKEFPYISFSSVFVKMALHGDIYNIIHQFFENLYKSNELSGYQIINLTGQSCKIDIFKDAIKEYIPGKLMRGRSEKGSEDYRLKLTCLDGAIRYVRDKRLGYAKVSMEFKKPSLPYELRGFTHTGTEVVLLKPQNHEQRHGSISRSANSVELRLHLMNTRGEEKHVYSVLCEPDAFTPVTYEEIGKNYGEIIPQSEADVIENGEVRYFVCVILHLMKILT